MHAVPTIREHIVQPHRSNPDTATKLTSPTHLRPIALKSRSERRKPQRNKAFQAEEEDNDDSEKEDSDDEEELSLLTRRVKQLWRKRNNNFRRPRPKGDRSESTSRGKSNKEITCYECKETGHYRNECPKLKKESSKREGFRKNSFRTKKGRMATWDNSGSDSSESDSEEQANVTLMATTSRNASDGESDSEEVFSDLSHSDLESCISKTLNSYQKLKQKFKALKEVLEGTIEEYDKLEITVSELKDENQTLIKERDSTNKQCLKLEEALSQAP
ncbi:hypothetical protein KIW84_064104 [Lathyrus oleraceus]|uniref:CCHC-type domain-containing protein n=1 Tax=Pisum sativum TaxID=3888 RepID=A0A9D4WBC2_PEA|nr:hypothetical protein KIW84_064104 [Pisum sativum]